MTPREKALELVDKYEPHVVEDSSYDSRHIFERQRQCALIAVDEILKTLETDIRDLDVVGNTLLSLITYWQEVKQEINNINGSIQKL